MARIERLDHIIISAGIKPCYLVLNGGEGGEEHNRQVTKRWHAPDTPAQIQTILPAELNLADHYIGKVSDKILPGVCQRCRPLHDRSIPQSLLNLVTCVHITIYKENM